MSNQQEIDFFIDQLLESAVQEFHSTEQYDLLKEKLERMDQNCNTMFTPNEKSFAIECFGLIMDVNGQEESYVYRKAFKDCVSVLRWMGVIA